MELDFILAKEKKKTTGKEKLLYDLIIIGGGPAGMTAAVYAARKRIATLLISKDLGGQVLRTSGVENYMGYKYITGEELMSKFKEQITHFPLDQEIGQEVESIKKKGNIFHILTRRNRHFKARSVIISSGKRYRSLGVQGEKKLIGRGISYCSVCDGPFFEGKDVAIMGGGNSGFQTALDLTKITSKIYLLDIVSNWRADPVLVEKVKSNNKVKLFPRHKINKIQGDNKVDSITIESLDSGQRKKLSVQGVFIEIGLIPNSEFVESLINLNQAKEIIIDCHNRTNIPGVFAAGDVTNVPEKQIIIAAGEGAKATLSAYQYLFKSV